MSDLKSDADLLHLALTHEGDEFAARVVNDLQTQLATMTAERDAAVLDASIARKQIAARELERQTEFRTRLAVEKERDAALAKVAVLRDALGLIHMRSARWSPSHCLARNALEATK